MEYHSPQFEIRQTETFSLWLDGLRDEGVRPQIQSRIFRLELGLFGDVRSVGPGVSELRVHSGPGYRIYFTRMAEAIILLLVGGNKGSQRRDIARAIELCRMTKRELQ